MSQTPAERVYRRALARLGPEERERERSRDIPYELSLHALAGHFAEAGERQGWLSRKGPLLAAVSGGGDSVALLWLFRTFYNGTVVAAHVNHGIRGRESDEDAEFVRGLALGWGLGSVERRLSVPEERRRGESLEEAARRVRYRELEGLAKILGAWGVALGHNRDDLAETALFNLLRGSGARGGAGMPEARGVFFRPLLGMRRGFLRDVLRVRGIPWREDRSNQDRRYTRNFIRLELLPLVERRINARAVEHLAAFAEDVRDLREDEEVRGAELLDRALASGPGDAGENDALLALDRGALVGMSPMDRALALREAGRRLGLESLSRRRVLELARLAAGRAPFTFQWGGGVSVAGGGGEVRWMNCGSYN